MALSLVECGGITLELTQALTGGVIQKIHQPQPFVVTLEIRVPGESFRLLICVEPKFARLHLVTNKFENPFAPPPFCQFLRSNLEGGRITSIEQEPSDRIVYFHILQSSHRYVLAVALTGNQANVLILNDQRIILRYLRVSRQRVGDTFRPPERHSHSMKSEPSFSFSPSERRDQTQNMKDKMSVADRFPLSVALEIRYQHEQEVQQRLEWYKSRSTNIRKALKQGTRRVQTLQAELVKAEKYREYQRYGELLKSQLSTIQPRQSTVQLIDYYDPNLSTLTLPLNALKDPIWNMEDYFRKYRKYLSALEHLAPRVSKAQRDIEVLTEELRILENEERDVLMNHPISIQPSQDTVPVSSTSHMAIRGKTRSVPKPMQPDSHRLNPKGSKKTVTPQTKHYRKFESRDGLVILVGKSAKDNDYLTLKVAKPDDLWLHARGTPGSHVIVRLEKATDVPHETLRDAASLALFYSDLKKSGKGEVIYTLRKFVKKSKGLKAGAVQVTREKSIWIELKQDRLDRLKGGI